MSLEDDLEFDKILLQSNVCDTVALSDEIQKYSGPTDLQTVAPPLENFNFPFQPYKIQQDFMQNLFSCILSSKIGIFESPTGTGKSLSLICGALTAFEVIKNRDIVNAKETIAEALIAVREQQNAENWLDMCDTAKVLEEKAKICEKLLENINLLDDRLALVKKGFQLEREAFNVKRKNESSIDDDQCDMENSEFNGEKDLILEEYVSDSECYTIKNFDCGKEDNNSDDVYYAPKVYYAVRTHSQLAQFLAEFRKTKFADRVRVVTLASRQNLCINNAVKKLGHLSLINDRCVQLQNNTSGSSKVQKIGDASKKKKSACPYYRRQAIMDLADQQLAVVQDIEDLADNGIKQNCCPYYSSRAAIPGADLVLLPYQILLSKSVRESCNVKLKDSVVIIDEAHNLIDTINSIHSCKIGRSTIVGALEHSNSYKKRYENRLKAKNLFYVRQLLTVLTNLSKFLTRNLSTKERVYKLNDFLFDFELADVNFFKLLRYMEKSMISKKLTCFYQRVLNKIATSNDADATKSSCSFVQVENFLLCFLNPSNDSRIVLHKDCDEQFWFKFISLNPAQFISELLTECRSVILAGGTMQPVSDLFEQLFYPNNIGTENVIEFSSGHVIPDKNLLPIVLCSGPTNVRLEFTYQNRNSNQLIDELGRILVNISNVVPGGVVCFYSSYEFENVVFSRLQSQNVLEKLQERRKLFREPKSSSEVPDLLENYARFIKNTSKNNGKQTGAILFAVVGGKMSEGINFSDDLARCVLMIGLPYPSKESVELQEKMHFLNTNFRSASKREDLGQIYYENLCAKAVNQSIGRAIRHQNDYASILLLDYRYSRPNVKKRLPSWIAKSLKVTDRFGQCLINLKQFFNEHNNVCN